MFHGLGLSILDDAGKTPIPAVMSFAQGMVAWWDSDYSGGIADGATLGSNAVNRATGSNAVLAAMPGNTGFVYSANKWRAKKTQSCWVGNSTAMRATGTDIVNAANGLGKQWLYILVWVPRLTSITTQYGCGWDRLAAANFTASEGLTRTAANRFTWGAFSNGAESAVDTQVFNQNAQMLEVSRPGGNQIQFGIDNVRTAAVAYGSGVTYNVDGFSIGGWAGNNTTAAAQGDAYYRAIQVWNRIPSSSELAQIYSFNVSAYSGFETIASLGAV